MKKCNKDMHSAVIHISLLIGWYGLLYFLHQFDYSNDRSTCFYLPLLDFFPQVLKLLQIQPATSICLYENWLRILVFHDLSRVVTSCKSFLYSSLSMAIAFRFIYYSFFIFLFVFIQPSWSESDYIFFPHLILFVKSFLTCTVYCW